MKKITKEEYQRRLKLIRGSMKKENLDALIIYSWKRGQVEYISGYRPNYIANVAMVIIPLEGKPLLFIRFPFDIERAHRASWIKDIKAAGNLAGFIPLCCNFFQESKLLKGKVGLITGDAIMDEMPYSLMKELEKSLPGLKFIPAFKLFEKARLVKSEQEIEILKSSAAIADAAVDSLEKSISPDISDYELISAAEAHARIKGADDFLGAISTKGDEKLVGPPEGNIVKSGSAIIAEVAVKYQGYWTQVARVFTLGKPSAEEEKIYKDTFKAYNKALKLRNLDTISQLAQSIYETLVKEDWKDYIEHDFGHGIGLDLPEAPSINVKNELKIKPGMVLVIHPAVRKQGVGGAFLGGTTVVTEKGLQPLHKIREIIPYK